MASAEHSAQYTLLYTLLHIFNSKKKKKTLNSDCSYWNSIKEFEKKLWNKVEIVK